MSEPVDVVIVGAGPSGAIMSLVLAEAGLKVLCLEQGGWTPSAQHPQADPEWEWRRYKEWAIQPWHRGRADDPPVESDTSQIYTWAGVGGASTIYTALWPRYRPSDFRKGQEHGLAPDWPITYEDLAPYYDRSDLLVGTSGLVGDPGMPPRGAFATPPMPLGPVGRHMGASLERMGWHWWPFPVGAISQAYQARRGCNHCGACMVGCWRGALGDAGVAIWPRALAAGAGLRPHAKVLRIETGADGLARGVEWLDRLTGERHFQPAAVTVVCGNGIGTSQLLLASADGRFPNGLANGSDQLGRNLMHHTLVSAEYWVDAPLDSHIGMIGGVISSEFAETDPSRGFVNGFNLNIVRGPAPAGQAIGAFSGRPLPWGREHHREFRRRFGHSFRAHAIGDDLPQADNRVTLSPDRVDDDGFPVARVAYRPHENDRRQMAWAVDRLRDLAVGAEAYDHAVVDYMGADSIYRTQAWHLLGTARMGDDPATSVVDRWQQSHEVGNLLVVDGSVLPTAGVVNPTSTVCALALRAAEGLRDRFAAVSRGGHAADALS